MQRNEFAFSYARIALVTPVIGAAIGDVMLGRCRKMAGRQGLPASNTPCSPSVIALE
jgi:hypothetical protein